MIIDTDGGVTFVTQSISTVLMEAGVTLTNASDGSPTGALTLDIGTSTISAIIAGTLQSVGPTALLVWTNVCNIVLTETASVIAMGGATNFGAVSLLGDENTLVNYGSIASVNGFAVAYAADELNPITTTIHNFGTIVAAGGTAIGADQFTNIGRILIVNHGIISSTSSAIDLLDGPNVVRNNGVITGDVLLGDGNGVFDSRFGEIDGLINGEGGNDTIWGSAADDRINGGLGADRMTGAAGADVFVFAALAESGLERGVRDRITDFQRGVDDIDLSQIDAGSAAGDQAFRFIGAKAFTAAGQVHVIQKGGERWVELNMDADRDAEFRFVLNGTGALSGADFIL